jgi:YbbR domain-containing protein
MDKFIDRMFDNKWFIRAIALVLALLLFENVYDEKNAVEENVPQGQEVETIKDVPVKIYYDTENLVVTGVPETVTITLTGPKNILQQAVSQRDFEVYVDLSEAEIGKQKVPIQIKDLSERLEVKIEPSNATVSVQEKVTKEFDVSAEFSDSILANGYFSEKVVINPNKVKITGAKDVIDKIVHVKANMDVEGPIKKTLTRHAEVLVLDHELNKLDVEVEPRTVEVTIPVKASSKTVPINVEQVGTPPNGMTVKMATLETNEAMIIGNKDVLEDVDSVRVKLDVSKISTDTVVTLPVIIPDGVVEVSPETVNVTVIVSKTESKTVSNIPIKIEGLSEKYNVLFRDPLNGLISLNVSGLGDDMKNVTASDFDALIDVSKLNRGEHDVAINVTGPTNMQWKLGKSTAKIVITQKED